MLKIMKRIPGGTLLIPMFLSALLNTAFPEGLYVGSISQAFFSAQGTNYIVGFLCFVSAMGLDVKSLAQIMKKQGMLLVIKFMIGKISDERFMILTKSYEKEQRELNEILEALDEQLADIEIQNLNSYQFTLLIKRYTEITELTAPLLKELVDKIVIHQSEMRNGQRTQEIDIYYRFIGTI